MRVGYVGYFSPWHTEWGVSDALEKYAKVDRYEMSKMDRSRFLSRKYDLLLTTAPHTLDSEFLREFKGPKVAHYFDLIFGWKGRDRQYVPKLKLFDLVMSTDGTDNKEYKKAGINRVYMKQAYNPEWYYPLDYRHYEQDVAFIGGLYTPKRKALFSELYRKFDFRHFGWRGDCRGEKHAEVCAKTKIMVCDNAVDDLPGYWSNRVYLHLACGAFVLHPRVPGMEKVFRDGKHLVYYDGVPDLVKKIRLYLDKEKDRKRIATAGYDLVRKHHTWGARMEEIWPLISDLASSATQTEQVASGCSCGTSGPALAQTAYSA